MEIAPITVELWGAFVEERKCWKIVDVTGAFVATDYDRSTTFSTREAAAYFIDTHSMQVALTSVGILHADA